jgi:hypothetical protein
MGYVHLMAKELSVAVDDDGVWQMHGTAAEKFGLVNEFLGYLADRLGITQHSPAAELFPRLAAAA